MKTKQATVIIDRQEWIVIDTDERRDQKVFCTLMSPDGSITWYTWLDENLIRGIV